MNERIRQLAQQATDWANNQNFYQSHYQDYMMERFAKLIVRECADMAESFHRHQYDMTGNLELHEFIREHFGVEE